VVTTDSEFHSLRRQLDREAEEPGARIVRVPVAGPDFAERFRAALTAERPTWAAISLVLFTTAEVITALPEILAHAASLDIPILVDAYHAFNALPLEVDRWPGAVFVTGGGYKYAEGGEGCCWMLLPQAAERYRPRYTGWFADFEHLEHEGSGAVRYGAGGSRFFGSTFDPTGLYRAVRVFEFFDQQGLSPSRLRAQSLLQTGRILDHYDRLGLAARGLGLATPPEEARRGAFVSFESARAAELVRALEARGVRTDSRGRYLRFGPAPYTTSAEIDRAMTELANSLA
jgi:kynureninase